MEPPQEYQSSVMHAHRLLWYSWKYTDDSSYGNTVTAVKIPVESLWRFGKGGEAEMAGFGDEKWI